MTYRFKKAVKAFVEDGVLTPEEKKELKKIAKEDNIDETDAEIYIVQELKRKKMEVDKKKNGIDWLSKMPQIAATIASVAGVVITVLDKMDKFNPNKGKK